MSQAVILDKSGALAVTGLSLQLKVRHACGTCHAYVIRFDVTDEEGVESQLNQDLTHLIELMRERANYGEYVVNDRKYFAIEIPDTNDAVTRMLSDEMPAIVLPGQVERESQSVENQQEAEREVSAVQSMQAPTQEDAHRPEQANAPVDHVESPATEHEEPLSLKESNDKLESGQEDSEFEKKEEVEQEDHTVDDQSSTTTEEERREEDKVDPSSLTFPPVARRGRGRRQKLGQ